MKKALLITLTAVAAVTAAATAQQMDLLPSFGSIPDQKEPDLQSVVTVDKSSTDSTYTNQEYSSSAPDESVILAEDYSSARFINTTVEKNGGDSSNSDLSNFYGLNSAVIAKQGSTLNLTNLKVTTDADGSNAVFSTGPGTKINIKNATINTYNNSSRGLDATYDGYINATNVNITTHGDHCAAFATDRGEGTVIVNNAEAITYGQGSPVIYSTGNIQVNNLKGRAESSEIACIEGKNSITIKNSTLEGSSTHSVMLYQSMSGDASVGTSVFTVYDSSLSTAAQGPFFYITNTNAKINISKTKLDYTSGILIQCSGNNSERGWGQKGANGGTLVFNASNQLLKGDIIVDSISRARLSFGQKTVFTGAVNSSNKGQVSLFLAKKARLDLTGDCYLDEFITENLKFTNIKTNGYTIYYNINNTSNSYLNAKTYILDDGGVLKPVSMTFTSLPDEYNQDEFNSQRRPLQPKDFSDFSGYIKVTDDNSAQILLVTEDGIEYKLTVMHREEDKNDSKKDLLPMQDKKQPGKPPVENKNKSLPPMNMTKGQKPQEPPVIITMDQLISYKDKAVNIKGILEGDTIVVMAIY